MPYAAVVLLAVAPFAAFLNDNRSEAEPATVLPYAAAVACALLAAVIVVRTVRPVLVAPVAVALGAGALVFFNFHNIEAALDLPLGSLIAVWACAVLAAGVIGFELVRRGPHRVRYAVLAAVVMTAVPSLSYTAAEVGDDAADARPAVDLVGDSRAARTPNVWFFMVDGYSRSDVLRERFGHDNGPFERALEARGFRVFDRATAAYPITHLSLGSTLDLRPFGARRVPNDVTDALITGGNSTVANLRRLGYRYAHAPSGTWSGADCGPAADLCVDPLRTGSLAVSEEQWALLRTTPVARLVEQEAPERLGVRYSTPTHVVRTVHAAQLPRPYFVLSHSLLTHPPYLFTGDRCARQTVDQAYLYARGTERTYAAAVRCANRRLTEAVDAIVARDRKAVIIIGSDHAHGIGLDWDRPPWGWTAAEAGERFKVLSAVRLPRHCTDGLPPSLQTVNTFRVVLACLVGRRPKLLPERSWLVWPRTGEIRPWIRPRATP